MDFVNKATGERIYAEPVRDGDFIYQRYREIKTPKGEFIKEDKVGSPTQVSREELDALLAGFKRVC